MQTIFNFEFRFDKNKENKSKIEKTFLGNQKHAAYRPHGYWPTRP